MPRWRGGGGDGRGVEGALWRTQARSDLSGSAARGQEAVPGVPTAVLQAPVPALIKFHVPLLTL